MPVTLVTRSYTACTGSIVTPSGVSCNGDLSTTSACLPKRIWGGDPSGFEPQWFRLHPASAATLWVPVAPTSQFPYYSCITHVPHPLIPSFILQVFPEQRSVERDSLSPSRRPSVTRPLHPRRFTALVPGYGSTEGKLKSWAHRFGALLVQWIARVLSQRIPAT
jgi:hypothetical protein